MKLPVIRRLLLLLTALAFLLATAVPGTAWAMPMPAGMAMAGSSGLPCDDCPAKVPASGIHGKMMPCGALLCFGGAVALPAAADSYAPIVAPFEYGAQAPASTLGVVLAPDPFPPRSAAFPI